MRRSLLLLAVCCACSSPVETMRAPEGLPQAPAVPPDPCLGPREVGDQPVRRLTRDEYDATVSDLLGTQLAPARAFPAEQEPLGFDNNVAGQSVSPLLAEAYLAAAEALAADFDVAAKAPCPAPGAACGAAFIAAYGPKAFRRPLTAAEGAALQKVYDDALAAYDHPTAVRLTLEVMLQSPRFLYRLELTGVDGAGAVALDDFELASRLSYFLWGTMPDAALFDAAGKGELHTPAQLAAQARRMLGDGRAHGVVKRFHAQWLGISHLATQAKDKPGFDALAPLMETESALFADWLYFEGQGDASMLYSARATFMNEALANFYALPGPTGADFRKVDLSFTQRQGVLTQGAVLATYAKQDQSSPVRRGKFVRERLLCQSISPPPGNVVTDLPAPTQGTTRDRFAAHVADPSCSACHRYLDPVGFGFEHYDAVGAYRSTENLEKIDATGSIVGSADVDGAFDGALQLGDKLAKSDAAKQCLARQWFRYAMGRGEAAGDDCSLRALNRAFAAAKYDLSELLVQLTQTDAFRFKKAAAR